jgi:hypothetical protein
MHSLQIEIPLDIGIDGIDTNPFNCASRAFSTLLGNGKPHKAHVFSFLNFSDINVEPVPHKWFGVFVHTDGDRVLFFPGLSDSIDWIETTKQILGTKRRQFQLDHFSAEPSRQMWHLTSSLKEHIPGGRLKDTGQESYHWFSLSVQSWHTFSPAHKRTIIAYETPQSDTGRRLSILRGLERPHYEVKMENVNGVTPHPYFLHMSFILSSPSVPFYNGSEFILPIDSPYLLSPLPEVIEQFQVWRNRICLSDQWDIQVITMLLPGKLSQAFTFNGFE